MAQKGNGTAGALIWNFVDRFGQQLLQFAVVLVVTNILVPDDYALVAMLTIFAALGNLIVESGFGPALIQKQNSDDRDFSSVFWFNLAMSALLYALLMAASPLIVAYFKEPQLYALSAVVFLSFPVNATMLIQTTILTKQLRFKQLAKIDLTAMVVSSITAVTMALLGCGVWTLAWQPITLAATKSILLWATSQWRPMRFFDFKIIKQLFGYAGALLSASIINTVFNNVYSLVLPRLYPRRELGYMSQANKISDPFAYLIYGSIQNAMFPIYSKMQDDRERLLEIYRKSIRFTTFVTFPVMVGLISIASPLMHLLFKAEWWPAIPYFQLLCLGGAFTILTQVNNNFIRVSGHTMGLLKIEIWKVVLSIVAILLLMRQSALAMVSGLIAVRAAIYVIYMLYVQHYTPYRMTMQVRDTVPYVALAAVMGAAVWALTLVVHSDLLLLPLQVVVGAAVYVGLAKVLGSTMLNDTLDLLLKRGAKTENQPNSENNDAQ